MDRWALFRVIILFFTHFLSSEEDKDVPLHLLTEVDLDHSSDGRFQVVPLGLGGEENLNGMRATRNTLQR